MLTEEEIEELRAGTCKAVSQEREGDYFRYANGPLAGLIVRLTPDATQYLHGRCQLTLSGPVEVLYISDVKKRLCFFHGYSLPGREKPTW